MRRSPNPLCGFSLSVVDFLRSGHDGPEQQELLRLIGTLAD